MGLQIFNDIAPMVLTKTLDKCAARNKTIANNIANIETPGYKRNYISFEDQLKSAVANGNEKNIRESIDKSMPLKQTDTFSPAREDGNNVNIDAEMSDLAKNQLEARAASVLLQARGAIIKSAVTEGKR